MRGAQKFHLQILAQFLQQLVLRSFYGIHQLPKGAHRVLHNIWFFQLFYHYKNE